MQVISALDYVLLPFFIAIIYGIAIHIRNRYYPKDHPWRRFFIAGLTVKLFGAVFIGMIYQYYYGGGDTFNYFHDVKLINSSASNSIVIWANLVLHLPDAYDIGYYKYTSQSIWYTDPASYTVSAIGAVFAIFTLNTYLPTSLLFAAVSYSGLWALFRTFAKIYPNLVRPIAVAILFIPSVFVWGSGLFKDTICMFGLGWLTYSTFKFLLQRDFSFGNILLGVLSFALIARVKIYILIGFVPALLLWILFSYIKKIRSKGARIIITLALVPISAVAFVLAFEKLGNQLGRYSITQITETSAVTRNYISQISGDEGSAYDLGEMNWESPISLMGKFPAAVNVTLFRPYLWESKKVIILLSGLESFLFVLIVIKVLFSLGLKRTFSTIATDGNIQFCLIFSILFAFAVGISSYNFGALSRYKIPALPFFALALVLIYYRWHDPKKKLFYFF